MHDWGQHINSMSKEQQRRHPGCRDVTATPTTRSELQAAKERRHTADTQQCNGHDSMQCKNGTLQSNCSTSKQSKTSATLIQHSQQHQNRSSNTGRAMTSTYLWAGALSFHYVAYGGRQSRTQSRRGGSSSSSTVTVHLLQPPHSRSAASKADRRRGPGPVRTAR